MPSQYIKNRIQDYEAFLKDKIKENKSRLEKLKEVEQEILDLKTLIQSLKEIP